MADAVAALNFGPFAPNLDLAEARSKQMAL